MAFPAEHRGTLKKRTWFKVKWIRNPPGLDVAGTYDLLMELEKERYKDFLELLKTVKTAECTRGLPVGFGKEEKEIDEWIKQNQE